MENVKPPFFQLKHLTSEQGQTAVEYIVLMLMVMIVIFVSYEAMRSPLTQFLETMNQGFQSVVRYGDRRIRAENVFEAPHPGHPSHQVPRHF